MLSLNFDDIDFGCVKTWNLIGDGNTKGVFQLESRLGQSMAKKLKPSNIEELAALISIMRPGCLEAFRDGKSVSNHFIDKKNGLESIDYFHPALESVLKTTFGEMVYQEQAMEICQKIANFDLTEADMLRKAIGKKNPEEMNKIKDLFLHKTQQESIVTKEEAEKIFSWIEKSQRYSFNKSHAISYAMNAYVSAYAKAHFTLEFFVSYLKFAKDKIDPMREIAELISNANSLDIMVKVPDFRKINKEFSLDNNVIYFGLTNIKGVGDSVFKKLSDLINHYVLDINKLKTNEILFLILDQLNSTASKNIISVGCFDYLKIGRKKMIFLLEVIQNLSRREKDLVIENFEILHKPIQDIFRFLLDKVNKKRYVVIESLIKAVDNPAYSLTDDCEWIANIEKHLLGAAITCSIVDSRNLEAANTDCKSLSKNSHLPKNIIVGAEIGEINIVKTKSGKNPGQDMAFIKIIDGTGSSDLVIFPKEFTSHKDILYADNTVLFNLEQSKKKDSFIVKKCWQL